MVNRDKGRALGDAVAVKNGDTDAVEEVDDILVNCRAAANKVVKVAAKCLGNLAEELFTKVDAKLTKEVRDLDHIVYKLGLALLFKRCLYLAVECLNIEGYKNDVSGLLLLDFLGNSGKTRRNINLDTHAVLSVDRNAGAIGVVGGKNADGLCREVNILHDIRKVPDDTALAEHNALALTCGAACKHEKCHRTGVNLGGVVGGAVLCKEGLALLDHRADILLKDKKVKSECLCNLLALLCDCLIYDKDFGIRTLCSCGEVRRCPVLIKRDKHRCGTHGCVVGKYPVIGIFADKSDMLSCDTVLDKRHGECAHLVTKLGVGLSHNLLVSRVDAEGICVSVRPSFANVLDHVADVAVVNSFSDLLFGFHNFLLLVN